ncbi:disulfide bond chaperone [Luteolibacter ambystomatis]|uniref:Disulfide bond chaperone n=1 Tax=Luteolibacter ambystomatis TaxID=2824561 RepID=A0A975J2M7_9BACT|nr:disulfide bond chaperone [Luteolibacter ambystomatis]QUE52864.1 disulfide bond chaperone [Luteolibacter ambystomatis]
MSDESGQLESPEEFTKIESIYVRHRNALMVRGQFTPIYTDYYLHLMQHGIRHNGDLDLMLKDFMALITLHTVARPWAETIAWTVNLRAPRINLFTTASSLQESVVGRLFTEDVREPDRNLFYSQVLAPNQHEPRISTLEVEGKDPVEWLAQYYRQSEQRPGRAFRLEDENFVLIVAQPDCDMEWFNALDDAAVEVIETTEETKLLESRRFRFHCGCTLDKILPVLGNWRERPDELFEGDDVITIQCPRCAARYAITRDML